MPANSIFSASKISTFTGFSAMCFNENPFSVQKIRQKQFRVSNFALFLVIFKWHHGSEGVKVVMMSAIN